MIGAILSSVLASSTLAAGQYVFEKQVSVAKLQSELVSAGFNVQSITCIGTKCRIEWRSGGEVKNPKKIINAHVYEDMDEARERRRRQMRAQLKRWRAGEISANEKDELLRGIAEMLLGE